MDCGSQTAKKGSSILLPNVFPDVKQKLQMIEKREKRGST